MADIRLAARSRARLPARRILDGNRMTRIKTALFIDFDNVYLSLLNDYSESIARPFANPSRWMPWLETGAYVTDRDDLIGERSILIRRCYGSPDRMRPFRAYFTRSGFQVVDCPPLTTSGKNSSDIVMTLDIADAIEHRTRFDEFVILSSDADFTPVALRLRAYDRITSILANQQIAAAFRSCCDVVINMKDFEPVVGDDSERAAPAVAPVQEAQDRARPATHADGGFDAIRADIKTAIDEELAAAPDPVVIGSLTTRIQQRWPVVRESDWLGTGGFKNFLREVVDGNVRLSLTPPRFIYDPRRHKAPNHLSELPEPMRDLVQRLYVVVGLPRLHPRQYQTLFKALAEQKRAAEERHRDYEERPGSGHRGWHADRPSTVRVGDQGAVLPGMRDRRSPDRPGGNCPAVQEQRAGTGPGCTARSRGR